jgi:hypothetical protein
MGRIVAKGQTGGPVLDDRGRYRVTLDPARNPPVSAFLPVLQDHPGTHARLVEGDLVTIGFIQGDPDHPAITGAFATAARPGPWTLPVFQQPDVSVLHHAGPTLLWADPRTLAFESPRSVQRFPTLETDSGTRTDVVHGSWTASGKTLHLGTEGRLGLRSGTTLGLEGVESVEATGERILWQTSRSPGPAGYSRCEIYKGEAWLEGRRRTKVVSEQTVILSTVKYRPPEPASGPPGEERAIAQASFALEREDMRAKVDNGLFQFTGTFEASASVKIDLSVDLPGEDEEETWQYVASLDTLSAAFGMKDPDGSIAVGLIAHQPEGRPTLELVSYEGTLTVVSDDWEASAQQAAWKVEKGMKVEADTWYTRSRTHTTLAQQVDVIAKAFKVNGKAQFL